MKALWVSQLWQGLHWEPLDNKQRELSFGKGHTWRASSQWRLDGYPSFGDTSTGNPYAWIISSGFAIKGKDSTQGSPESCLACLLAHNMSSCSCGHCISSASSSTTAMSAKNDKNSVQLVFHNGTFFYINSSLTNDPIWHQIPWATLVHIMAWCLMAPSH